jgi:NAD(P)-dependent dehydrogenase (short-subunit alcohol dehydrogenase family)
LKQRGVDKQQTVLITGAAKRIGRGIALRLAREGYRVALHYNTSKAEAEETAAACPGAELFQANLEIVDETRRMFAQIDERLDGLYGLVNNAARFTRFDPLDIEEADWDFIHRVNLKGTFFCCQSAARIMKRAGSGRIVNISSLGGLRPWANHAHYCASKAGVIMLTKALAKAWAPEITVNSVAPGVIPFPNLDDEGAAMIRNTPAGRGGTPDEIADAVLFFLRSTEFITGQTIAVDGGLSLR